MVFVFLSALAVALLVYLVVIHDGYDARTSERFCTSRGCLRHAGIIGLSDATKTPQENSPCEHFGRFICSAWQIRHERRNVRRRFTRSVTEDAIVDQIISVENFNGNAELPISQRPALMIDLCLKNRAPNDTMGLETLLNFMRDTGFGFPAMDVERSDYSRPLRAMTELANKWALPLWFHVDIVLPEDGSPNRTISLSHSIVSHFFDTFQDALMAYEEVYFVYVHILTKVIYKGNIEERFHDFIHESKFMQKYIFGNLSGVARGTLHNPIWIKIKHLPSFVKNVSVEHWLEALRPLWITDPPISEEDTVYVADRELLVAMNTLFTAYTAKDIYLHINWWFVQTLGALTSNALFESLRRDPERGPFFQKLICSIQVILNYNTVLASEKRVSLSASERAAVMAAISNVHTIAVSKVSSVMGSKLALLLEKTQPVIWPQDPYAEEEHLLRLYGNQTNDIASNIFELWLSRGIGYQQSQAFPDVRSIDAAIFRAEFSAVSSHHAISGAVSLSLAMLKSPYYYPDVTSAIIYGGIGFTYAVELVRALNSFSVLLDGRDAITPSEANFSSSFIWVPYTCAGMNATAVFPNFVALELAYSTYLKFRSDYEDVRLGNAKHYSPEQVFFASVCYVMCDMASGADECEASMRNFPAFGDAFSCPMREEKCAILS
ncbi:hypothetical protein V5799_026498 [Amblyomma americanum]|uniref:M13 family peptidase n=1 Tax=Amblyomma americanum TaxID=6943 RepID=A0AAQ4DIE4_AMBAM